METSQIADTALPTVRYRLKAKVIESGYHTFSEFADKLCVHRVYLSKVLNGHEFPSPTLQRRLAEKLGLTIRELMELL
jgi:transcriptional regulator with XRE-family HTH domain